jgi:hypothetical protein
MQSQRDRVFSVIGYRLSAPSRLDGTREAWGSMREGVSRSSIVNADRVRELQPMFQRRLRHCAARRHEGRGQPPLPCGLRHAHALIVRR